MFDLSFLQLLTRAIATIVVLALMGFCVAGFARLLGDRGPAYDGKLTLNPFVHMDIFGLLPERSGAWDGCGPSQSIRPRAGSGAPPRSSSHC